MHPTGSISRIILGGLAAGVIMNIVDGAVNGGLFATQFDQFLTNADATDQKGGVLAFWICADFVYALTLSWLNVALRARYGRGPGSYLRAALVVWVVAYYTASADVVVGLLPAIMHGVGSVITWVGITVGAIVADRLNPEPAGA
jgi:hypothetical protein